MQRRLFLATLAALAAPSAAQPFRELQWDELVPKGWDPMALLRGKPQIAALPDSDPQVQQLMSELRRAWDDAPTNPALDGTAVKLPGYLVPLEQAKGELKEFLLVPYFGACIHTPPPPANQIVHVVASPPVQGFRTMETVWVSGRLQASRRDSAMGTAGYRIDAAKVERYVFESQR